MDIILDGMHDSEETLMSLAAVLRMFQERYHIKGFHEIHLSITLVDQAGDDVELIDDETGQTYRSFEVCRDVLKAASPQTKKYMTLVVDNTRVKDSKPEIEGGNAE